MTDIVKDAKGREIEVREVVGSAMSRLARLSGEAFGANLWTTATIARASVVSIDGVPLPPRISSLSDIDGLWDSVDAEATAAAIEWMQARQEKAVEEAKNSSAPQDSGTASGS